MRLFKRDTERVAVVQMPIIHSDREENLRTAKQLIDEAARNCAGLICLPQAFATGINLPDLRDQAEPIPSGPTTQFLVESATRAGAYVVAGVLEKDGRDIYDSVVLIDPAGQLCGKYRRWFLWQREKDFITPGKPVGCVQTNMGRIGLIAGYDINFPESCRHYFRERVDIIICAANILSDIAFPVQSFCRARAAENHCYLIFCSSLGEHPYARSRYMGKSMVTCDPLFLVYEVEQESSSGAEVVCQADDREQVLLADLFIYDITRRKGKVPEYKDFEYATDGSGRELSWVSG
jgi:predicted amidohydrolase